MWIGWEPGSKGVVEINGGTINVTGMFGMDFEGKGGVGEVHVNSGSLNLKQLHPSNSIREGSVLDIKEGKVTIAGDMVSTVNSYIAAGKITAYGGAGTLSVVVEGGVTTITSATTAVNDIEGSFSSKVYPNPTTQVVTVSSPSHNTLQIMDVFGKSLINQDLSEGLNTIDVVDLPDGILIFKIGDQIQRILKN